MALSKLFSRLILQLAKHSPASAASPQPATTDGKQLCSPLQCTLAADVYRWISLQRRPISQSTAPISSAPPIRVRIPVGDKLIERIRSSMRQEHGRFDGISPPQRGLESNEIAESPKVAISVEDARKLLKASRVEAVRARLRAIPSSCVPYTHFAQICREAAGGVDAFGREIEASLDKSGAVVIVGDVVLLRPEQVARAIQNVILMSPEGGVDPRSTELREMETEKAIIDTKAEAQVKRELWAGLGLVLLQTTVFIRLTFWELSWDVMEPICFFTTSTSFMLGYAFFLRTANEPSFEGFFAGRFASRQQRLMKAHGFNLHRFNELRNALSVVGSISACSHSSHPCRRQSDVCDATLIRAAH